jgi:hypothetical protein
VDAQGKIVKEAKVASEPEAVVAFFEALGFAVKRIGLEAGPLSHWLHAGLKEAGFETVLLETRHVKAALSAMTVKTDRKDARGLAQLLRMGWFQPVHAKSMASQEVRALLVGRKQLLGRLIDVHQLPNPRLKPLAHLVASSRDPASDIFFTRLTLLRCEPKQRSCRLRLRDPARIVIATSGPTLGPSSAAGRPGLHERSQVQLCDGPGHIGASSETRNWTRGACLRVLPRPDHPRALLATNTRAFSAERNKPSCVAGHSGATKRAEFVGSLT